MPFDWLTEICRNITNDSDLQIYGIAPKGTLFYFKDGFSHYEVTALLVHVAPTGVLPSPLY